MTTSRGFRPAGDGGGRKDLKDSKDIKDVPGVLDVPVVL
jgi:hypothetical protein